MQPKLIPLPYAIENTNEEENPFTQQVLLKCPNLNQCYFSELHEMALFSNHYIYHP